MNASSLADVKEGLHVIMQGSSRGVSTFGEGPPVYLKLKRVLDATSHAEKLICHILPPWFVATQEPQRETGRRPRGSFQSPYDKLTGDRAEMSSSAQAFSEWAVQEGCTSSGPLSQLKDKRIIIDAEIFVDNLLTSATTREPLLPALGGLPFALKKHVDAHIAGFRDHSITPTFVFPGIDLACRDRTSIARESRAAAQSLNEAWNLYSQSKADEAVAEFGKSCNYHTYHILRWLQSHLHHQGIRVQTAPYHAAAQAIQLESENFGDAVYGSLSCLVYGADSVIVAFDWEPQTFKWVERSKCLTKLGVNDDQFIDLALLSGLSLIAAPEQVSDSPMPPLQIARNMLARSNNSGLAACEMLKNEEYKTLFMKARTAVKHGIVIDAHGEIKAWESAVAPFDLHEVTSPRLSDEMYFYMSRGVAGPRVLNWRTKAEIFECPPLDGGSSQAYQQMVLQKLSPLRARSVALLTPHLHHYYRKQDVTVVPWHDETSTRQLSVPDAVASEPTSAAKKWRVDSQLLAKGSGQLDVTQSPLLFAVTLLSEEGIARQTMNESGPALHQTNELVANTVLRFLQDRGYINTDHTLSACGKALKAALEKAKQNGYMDAVASPSEAEEAIFMAFELHRLDALNTTQMFPAATYLGAPMRGSETDKAYTLLLSRIACLGSFRHDEIGFTGPLSRHLLAYHQMAAAVRGALRDLVEVHALNMLLSGAVSRDLKLPEYTDLGCNLPLLQEPDLGLALAVKSFLDEASNDSSKRADITLWFNHAHHIDGDLQKAWKMWGAINAGIQAADSGIVNSDTKTMFKNADEWLAKKLEQSSPTTNGK